MNYTTTDQNSEELLNTKYILGFNVSTNRKRPIYYKYKGFNEINDVNKELHKGWPLVEFLREGQRVKPYIDYDEKQEYNDNKELYEFQQEGKKQLLKRLLNIFIEALNVLGCDLNIKNVLCLDGSRILNIDNKKYFKYSFHITTTNNNKVFNNTIDCKNILLPELENQDRIIYGNTRIFKNIDNGVYGKTQRMRTINSHKTFTDNVLMTPINDEGEVLRDFIYTDYLIQYVKDDYNIIEPNENTIKTVPAKRSNRPKTPDPDKTDNKTYTADVLKLLKDYGIYTATIQNVYTFENSIYYNINYDNTKNSCIYGNTEHTRPARGVCIMYGTIYNGMLYVGCRGAKCKRRKNKNLGCILERSPLETPTEAEQVKVKYLTEDQKNTVNKTCTEYIDNDKYRALLIKSRCGTGKTYLLNEYVTKYINIIETTKERPARVLMISTRQSYTRSICSQSLSGLNIISYLDYKQDRNNDPENLHKVNRLCVSMEGLRGLMMSKYKPYDVLIFDESESISRHLYSTTIKAGAYGTFQRLQTLIKFSKKIFMLDADLSTPSLNLIPSIPNENIIKINNTYNNNKRVFNFTYDKKEYISELKAHIILNKRLYIVCLSKTEAEGLRKELTPILNMVNEMEKRDETRNQLIFITGDIGDKEKRQLSNVNKIWTNAQIVITTSATGAGVDFNVKEHFDYVYGFITAGASPPSEFLQIIHRVRHPKSNIVNVLLDSKINNDFKKSYIYTIENAKEYIKEVNKTIINDDVLYTYENEAGFIVEEEKERHPAFTNLTYYNYLNNVMNNNNNNYLLCLKLIIEQHKDSFIMDPKKYRQKATKNEISNILNNTEITKTDLNNTRLKMDKTTTDKRQLEKNIICKMFNIHTNNRDEDIKGILDIYTKTAQKSIINNVLMTYIRPEHTHKLIENIKEFTDTSDRVKQITFNLYRRLIQIMNYDHTTTFILNKDDVKGIYDTLSISSIEQKTISRHKLNEYKTIQAILNKYGLKIRNIYDRKTVNKKKINTLKHYEITPDRKIYDCLYLKVIKNNYYKKELRDLIKTFDTYKDLLINKEPVKRIV